MGRNHRRTMIPVVCLGLLLGWLGSSVPVVRAQAPCPPGFAELFRAIAQAEQLRDTTCIYGATDALHTCEQRTDWVLRLQQNVARLCKRNSVPDQVCTCPTGAQVPASVAPAPSHPSGHP